MLASVGAVTLLGLDARPVRVECSTGSGLPGTRVVGMPDTAIREAGDRVKTAAQRSGFSWPENRVLVNLAPAALPKAGAGFDLAIALGVLGASKQLDHPALRGLWAFGELGLDGTARPVAGTLAVARVVHALGGRLLVPRTAATEAALIDGLEVVPVEDLREAVEVLRGERPAAPVPEPDAAPEEIDKDLVDVRGQPLGRRALELAAAGAHHLLFVGPPGCGKSMLAERLPSLLPRLSIERALEVAAVHSIAGARQPDAQLSWRPPFRAPHHTTSTAGLVGGGVGWPRPGELSLAHRGVLFVDELLEIPRPTLDALRQPLERGEVVIVRSRGMVRFPAEVQLVAATNPCPCGHLGTSRGCRCRPDQVERYRGRLSGPLLDRIDLQVELRPVGHDRLVGPPDGEASAPVAERVSAARALAAERWAGRLNAGATPDEIRETATEAALRRLAGATETLALSARGFDRALRVARTVADLAGDETVTVDHVDEALAYRLAPTLATV